MSPKPVSGHRDKRMRWDHYASLVRLRDGLDVNSCLRIANLRVARDSGGTQFCRPPRRVALCAYLCEGDRPAVTINLLQYQLRDFEEPARRLLDSDQG